MPKALRDVLGLRPGEVELSADGSALRVEPVSDDAVEERAGRLVIPATGEPLSQAQVDATRHGDQR